MYVGAVSGLLMVVFAGMRVRTARPSDTLWLGGAGALIAAVHGARLANLDPVHVLLASIGAAGLAAFALWYSLRVLGRMPAGGGGAGK
jgi:hypothetical protein